MKTSKKQSEAGSVSILGAIRADQARREQRALSQSTVRAYEKRALAVLRATPFTVLAGMR